jgi:hypothetical protein
MRPPGEDIEYYSGKLAWRTAMTRITLSYQPGMAFMLAGLLLGPARAVPLLLKKYP